MTAFHSWLRFVGANPFSGKVHLVRVSGRLPKDSSGFGRPFGGFPFSRLLNRGEKVFSGIKGNTCGAHSSTSRTLETGASRSPSPPLCERGDGARPPVEGQAAKVSIGHNLHCFDFPSIASLSLYESGRRPTTRSKTPKRNPEIHMERGKPCIN